KALPKGVTAQPLARTSPQSWGETDKNALARGEAKADPQDKKGAVPVAVVAPLDAPVDGAAPASATPPAPAEGAKKGPKARLVVVGTANLASNQFLGAQGNRDFFLNIVSWLAEDESSISVRARDAKSAPIVLTPPQAELVLWGPVAVLPGAVILVGILAVVSRRRSRSGEPVSRWITIAVLVLLVAGLGGFYYYDTYWLEPAREKKESVKGRLWSDLEPKDVEGLTIKRKGETVRVKRTDSGWELLEPIKTRADRGAVDGIVTSPAPARVDRQGAAGAPVL